jgi:trk system potassium uptake protein TrkA
VFLIVVGCGRVGSELAYRLYTGGHQVTVIDQVGTSFEHLSPEYRGRTVTGEVLGEEVLKRAGIEQADGLAAVTNSDSVNGVVGYAARTIFKVPNVVVRNYDPRFLEMHEAFGLQTVASTAWGARRMEELFQQVQERGVFSAGSGEVEVYEIRVPLGWAGRPLAALLSPEGCQPEGCLPVALTRAGRAALPGAEATLLEGDVIHVSATPGGIASLRARLGSGEGR